jgi:hypothetical protein
MKKIFTYVLLLLSISAISQTTISTGAVSGTWTLAGSPYIVTVSIGVSGGQSLTIDPGVVVKFMPTTKFNVVGQLIASGTAALPIIFEANDTTGWSNQAVTIGGWSGLHMKQYVGSTPDNSILNYCTIKDAKYGYTYVTTYNCALTCERELVISNCTIRHNTTGTGMYLASANVALQTYSAADTIEMNGCTVYDNSSVFGVIRTGNSGGFTKIINSELYNNHVGSTIGGIWNNLLIENNLIHHNDMINDSGPIKLSIGEATIRGNKIYNNTCQQLAAVGCRSGHVTIENNLICNNYQSDGSCGASGGGGGIHLSHNEGAIPFTDTYYIVRNNVIANNFSAYGGGGVYVYHSRATISNNHIINNSVNTMGVGVLILDPVSEVNLQNNIFFSKKVSGMVDTINAVYVLSANSLKFDYNYIPSKYYHSVLYGTSVSLIVDTTHNVIGTNPQLIAPTINNSYLTSALTADFNILPSSPCLDQGDTLGCFPALVDYLGNNRVNGAIEIGAFERTEPAGINNFDNTIPISVFPNPATDHLCILFEQRLKNVELKMYDISGNVVYRSVVSDAEKAEIATSDLAPGIYFVHFQTPEFSGSRKVVIMK